MANHKSAKKRARQNVKKNLQNKFKISRSRTFIKKIRTAIEEGNKELATKLLPQVQSYLFRTNAKKNTAARKTARLAKQVNGL